MIALRTYRASCKLGERFLIVSSVGYNEESYCPPIAIDAFVRSAAPEIEASPTKTQMWVKKVPRHIFPTANTDRSVMYWGHKNWTEDDIKFAVEMHQPKFQ